MIERSDKPTLPLPFMSALGFHLASPGYVLKAFASRDRSARAHLKSPLMSPGIVTSIIPSVNVLSEVLVSPETGQAYAVAV